MQREDVVVYGIALGLMPGIGDAVARNLISYFGDPVTVCKASKSKLLKVRGIGEKYVQAFSTLSTFIKRAEQEYQFIQEQGIDVLFYFDKHYPDRLQHCPDAPFLLYAKGNYNFNVPRCINIVGTRHATEYGKMIVHHLVKELSLYHPTIVSGLAYGIDILAHKAALEYQLQNIAVLGHGLDRVYPHQHRGIAKELQEKGALLTEFKSETNPDKVNFPKRNRIVAGMCDATIVIESAIEGGAMITAEIANNYHRDVFAFPGNIHQSYSVGCNTLIKQNKAHIVTSASDIIHLLGWDDNSMPSSMGVQKNIPIDLSEEETMLLSFISEADKISIEGLAQKMERSISSLSMILLQLEMKGHIKNLPGKYYICTSNYHSPHVSN